ncbi:hypothetical protein DN069_33955 [Streptacidiphilus pinicola]|uniref:Uncharacterized protein n=1 Tax=Streptacidiphilus pinicola TaxID=2219663 RepID=A0A2X0I8F8_9ACTN|nr:hypothetical protein DN069_33955 [Streptacidiphilus pinicola]
MSNLVFAVSVALGDDDELDAAGAALSAEAVGLAELPQPVRSRQEAATAEAARCRGRRVRVDAKDRSVVRTVGVPLALRGTIVNG